MKKYIVSGMSCAACSARVEGAVSSVLGVSSCSVNLLAGTMSVEGGDESDIILAVKNAGYSAISREEYEKMDTEADVKAKKRIYYRLIFSLALLLPLMYISMGYVMWGFPLPSILAKNHVAVALTELFISGAILIINNRFFVSGTRAVIHRSPNMDTLIALGSGVSFVYSTVIVIKELALSGVFSHKFLHGLYFESAAMIITLITVGKLLEERAKELTKNK